MRVDKNNRTGSVIHSTSSSAELTDKVQGSGEIVAAAVDENSKYLVTATSSKHVRVWNIDGLSVVSERLVILHFFVELQSTNIIIAGV